MRYSIKKILSLQQQMMAVHFRPWLAKKISYTSTIVSSSVVGEISVAFARYAGSSSFNSVNTLGKFIPIIPAVH